MITTIKHQLLSILWAVLVFILCDMPTEPLESVPAFPGMDKLVHTGFFFVLTVFMFYGKIRQQKSYTFRIPTVIKILLVAVAFGAFIELLQWRVFTYRSADWWDLFCDSAGVGMGVFSYVFLHRSGHEKFV